MCFYSDFEYRTCNGVIFTSLCCYLYLLSKESEPFLCWDHVLSSCDSFTRPWRHYKLLYPEQIATPALISWWQSSSRGPLYPLLSQDEPLGHQRDLLLKPGWRNDKKYLHTILVNSISYSSGLFMWGFMRHLCIVSILPAVEKQHVAPAGRRNTVLRNESDVEKTYFSQVKEGTPRKIYILFEHFQCFTLLAGSWVMQCSVGTAVLMRRNTDVVRSRECSPAGEGCLTATCSAHPECTLPVGAD